MQSRFPRESNHINPVITRFDRDARAPLQILAKQAFSRAAGAPLLSGNKVQLLRNAAENYPAWLETIAAAKRTIHFESYIIHGDEVGQQFAEALAAKAREGVRVRLIYDWMGALRAFSHRLWKSLRQANVEIRCFNRPRLDGPFDWLNRDHRKMLSVDGRIGFVTGLCIGRNWVGNSERGIEPWRDTGVRVEGPAVRDLERAFAQMWSLMGIAIPEEDQVGEAPIFFPDGIDVRIVASSPNTAGLYRFDQLVAAIARHSIWLTDAYFLGTTPYIQALGAAAMDGVDVRLLLPRASDVPIVGALSRAGYRVLLEAGVRVFEWNGTMLHAKTAVADGRWARVGSTNLNIASWLTNWELDVIVEDEGFGQQMKSMYLEDLNHSTEIVLGSRRRPGSVRPAVRRPRPRGGSRGSAGGAATGLLRLGNTVAAAIASRRPLGSTETVITAGAAVSLLCIALVLILWPRVISWLLVVLCLWVAASLLIKAFRLLAKRNH